MLEGKSSLQRQYELISNSHPLSGNSRYIIGKQVVAIHSEKVGRIRKLHFVGQKCNFAAFPEDGKVRVGYPPLNHKESRKNY